MRNASVGQAESRPDSGAGFSLTTRSREISHIRSSILATKATRHADVMADVYVQCRHTAEEVACPVTPAESVQPVCTVSHTRLLNCSYFEVHVGNFRRGSSTRRSATRMVRSRAA